MAKPVKKQLTKKDIKHIADLSNLSLTETEIKKFTPQISKIIDFVTSLSEVDTSDVSPTSQTTGLTNVFRKDIINTEPMLSNNDALSATDKTNNGYFKVPAVLSERTSE